MEHVRRTARVRTVRRRRRSHCSCRRSPDSTEFQAFQRSPDSPFRVSRRRQHPLRPHHQANNKQRRNNRRSRSRFRAHGRGRFRARCRTSCPLRRNKFQLREAPAAPSITAAIPRSAPLTTMPFSVLVASAVAISSRVSARQHESQSKPRSVTFARFAARGW